MPPLVISLPSSSSPPSLWRDYLTLCKPRVVALMILTSAIGMCLALPSLPPLETLLFANLGIALCAAAAAALNHVLDRRIDAKMTRTQGRPLPQQRLSSAAALRFAALLAAVGMALLLRFANPLTAALTLAALLGYAIVYTTWLKYSTPQNIVIGGLSGAVPPLLGWTAVTGAVHPYALLLVLIIFVWTPPHFWALALDRREDYVRVGVPMLPVTHGEDYTRLHILLYTLLLWVASLLPFAVGQSGGLYLLSALLLGGVYCGLALALMRRRDRRTARLNFNYSILYLGLLFAAMLVDHYLLPPGQPLLLAPQTL